MKVKLAYIQMSKNIFKKVDVVQVGDCNECVILHHEEMEGEKKKRKMNQPV